MQPEPTNQHQPPPGMIGVCVRRICCSQCVGNGVCFMRVNKSPLDVNPLPPQQILCPQCQGQRFIDVLVPVPQQPNTNGSTKSSDGSTEETKAEQKISQP